MHVKVKILKDGVKGADDGANVRSFPKDGGPDKDGTYTVSEALALVMIEAGEAEEVKEDKPSVTERAKGKKAAAADKAAAEKAAADKAAAEKAAADKAAAEKAAADKAAAEKAAGNGLPGLPGLPKANNS